MAAGVYESSSKHNAVPSLIGHPAHRCDQSPGRVDGLEAATERSESFLRVGATDFFTVSGVREELAV